MRDLHHAPLNGPGLESPLYLCAMKVGIIMGSKSDLPVLEQAAEILTELGVQHEMTVVSAHRTPDRMVEYARSARDRGIGVICSWSRRCSPPSRHGRIADQPSCGGCSRQKQQQH